MSDHWRPTAPLKNIQLRAELYAKIRAFFTERGVLEVETPLLCQHTVTDPHIESFSIHTNRTSDTQIHAHTFYLQTSPEYAMKRLLAAGCGAIYQITKAFRLGESGHHHNPEFTMLEWYRPGFNHYDLMDEIDLFLQSIIGAKQASKISYRNLFLQSLDCDPFKTDLSSLKKLIIKHHIQIDLDNIDHDTALQILLSHLIEPTLGVANPVFLYDFPPSQAALSKIRQDDPPVAERFELYIHGAEMANGFHELTDTVEQQKRFEKNQFERRVRHQIIPAIDHYFIDALKSGLPDCAGVAIGIDRLLMQYAKTNNIKDVIAFPFEKA